MRRIRKSVSDLNLADFVQHPYWEYASDEEGIPGQDESTVRPISLSRAVVETAQIFAQAAFVFPNGCMRAGVVTLNAGDDVAGHQPALFVPSGSFNFYYGALRPSSSTVRRAIAQLRKISAPQFPISYASVARGPDNLPRARGLLTGLYWLSDIRNMELSIVA